MKRVCCVLLIAALGFIADSPAFAAAERATPAEAEAMVKKAVAYIKKNGREKAFAEFMKLNGPFVDRDLYITVYDAKGVNLAHTNPKMVGKNMMELRDADGKMILRERLEIAKKQGKGWQEYKFLNPMTMQVEPKTMYFEQLDDITVACGAYKP